MTCALLLETLPTAAAGMMCGNGYHPHHNNHRSNHVFAPVDYDDNDCAATSTWATDKIRRMGYYHVLETTHAELSFHNNNQVSALVGRLDAALRALSCHIVRFDATTCGATVQAAAGMEFQVVVWKKATASLVVELQHVSGNTHAFYSHYAPTLLQSAQAGGMIDDDSVMTDNNSTTAFAMDTLYKQAAVATNTTSYHYNQDQVVTETLDFIRRCLLCNENNDQLVLGLETLVAVMHPALAGSDMAAAMAREAAVVLGESALTQFVGVADSPVAQLAHHALQAMQQQQQYTQ